MEYRHKAEVLTLLAQIQQTIETIERRNQNIITVHDYLLSESSMEKEHFLLIILKFLGNMS